MKKKSMEIATNTSSGAEKVEKIEQESKQKEETGAKATQTSVKTVKKTTAKGGNARSSAKNTAKAEAAMGNGENKVNDPAHGLAEKEAAVAKARVEVAQARKEKQQKRKAERMKILAQQKEKIEKRLAERKAKAEKRAAERKAMAEKREAERKARAEKRRAEREAMIRERAHAKANKNQEEYKKKAEKQNKRKQYTNATRKKDEKGHGERNKGYGGWLAAVIALGVTTLALTTAVTVGAVEMSKSKKGLAAMHRGTMYELSGVMEHVDDDLERARISASASQQSRILTDLLVQARLAEMDLERLPMEAEASANVTSFVNKTARECERMLQKLRRGEKLDEEDFKKLESLYEKNHAVRMELNTLMENLTDKDIMQYAKDGAGKIGDALKRLEEMTLEEGRAIVDKTKDKINEITKQSAMVGDEASDKISPTEAENLCKRYFSDYKITDFQCVGETNTRKMMAYNVQGYDENGTLLFAEIDQKKGELIRFDYYEDCNTDTFDIQNAERIAEEFLEKLGYDDMEVVRFKANGTMTDFTFVYEEDDVAYYPDEVRVKICRSRGVVTGFDASKYLQNHHERKQPKAALTMGEAYEKLHDKLTVESSRLAVLKMGKGERVAYEFLCSYGEDMYFVYMDANTGEEISIINARTVS